MADDKASFETELIDGVSKSAKKQEGALARLKKTVGRFSGSVVGKATQKLASFTKTAVTIGAAVGGALVAGVASLTVGMVDFAQRSRQAFSLLAKHGEIPERLFQRSTQLAEDLGLEIKGTTKQIQKFRALQFTQDQAEALIKMGADMQALGASGEEVGRIFAQLGQIKAKGVLQTEELRTLAESGVSTEVVFAALAKQLNKTPDAIKKMVSAGEITGTQALNAIGAAILVKTGTKQFGEAGKKFADNTLTGMANRMKARMQRVFLRIGDQAAPAINAVAQALFKEFDTFLKSDTGKAFFKGIADGVGKLAKGLQAAIPFIKQFLGGFSAGAADTFREVAGAFEMMLKPFTGGDGKAGLAIMRSLGETLGALVVLLGAVGLAFGGLLAGATIAINGIARLVKSNFDLVVQILGSLVTPFVEAFNNIAAILDSTSMTFFEKSIGIGKAIVQGVVQGIRTLANLPVEVLKGMFTNAVNAAEGVLGIGSPSKVFEDIGKNTALGFNKGLIDLPTQNIIHSTLGNDNGVRAPTRGNLSVGGVAAPQGLGGGGARTMNVFLTVEARPGVSAQEAREQGRATAAGMFDVVHEFFDDVTIEEAV